MVKKKVGRRKKEEMVTVPVLSVQVEQDDEAVLMKDLADQKEADKQEQRISKSLRKGLEASLEVADALHIFHDRIGGRISGTPQNRTELRVHLVHV